MSVWNHDGDVVGSLRRNELVEKFKVGVCCGELQTSRHLSCF